MSLVTVFSCFFYLATLNHSTSIRKANFVGKVVALECCEKTVCLVADITGVINSRQMLRKYRRGAAARKLRVEEVKRDKQLKKKMPHLLLYGFETSLISNIKRVKPLLN